MKKKYIVDGKIYEIPDEESGAFLKDFPNAKVSYNVDGTDYEIPHKEADAFETDMGLKKKVGSNVQPTKLDNGLSDTPKADNGFDNMLHPFKDVKDPSTIKKVPKPVLSKDELAVFSLDKAIKPQKQDKPIPGYTAPKTLIEAHSQDKNISGNLWNSFTTAIGRLGASGADLTIQLLNKVMPSEEGYTDEERLKKLRSDVAEPTRSATTELIGANVTPEEKANFDKNLLTSTAGGLVEMIPAIGGKGLGLLLLAYDHGMESINSTEEGKALPENLKTVFSGTVGAVVGAMDRLSLTKIFGKESSKVATGVTIKVLTNLVKTSKSPVTAEIAEKAIMAELKSLKNTVVTSGKKVLESAAIEGLTETGQEGVTMLAETILNKSQGEEVFKEKSFGDNLERLATAGLQGVIGGGVLGGIAAPFSSSSDYISEKLANAKGEEDLIAIKDELLDAAEKKKMTKTELSNLSETIDNYIRINKKVPADIPNRKEVVEKIVEGEDIQSEIDKKEKELESADMETEPEIRTDIEALNKRAEEIKNEILKPEETQQESNITVEPPQSFPEPITVGENTQPNEVKTNEIPITETPGSTTNESVDSNIGTSKETTGEGGGIKEPPVDTKQLFGEGEEAGKNKKELDEMANDTISGGDIKKYLSGETIVENQPGTELRNPQEYEAMQLTKALEHGIATIEKTKEIFGDKYVEKTLDYIEQSKMPIENKALLYVSLENEMAKMILAEPDNVGLKKLEDLVRTKSQALGRVGSKIINYGRLRAFAKTGYDISKVTDKFFSSKEQKHKQVVEKLVQADAETIQKQYEESKQETGLSEADIEAKVKEGVESEIAKIYEALPKEKKTAVDKAISALDKVHAKLKGKTYSDATGMIALIDAGVVTIRAALKASVHINKAVELGIEKIKKAYEEKYGKKWEKEAEFRKDYLDGFKSEGAIDAQQKRQSDKEYRMLETERNRQLAKVADLNEKLKTLQSGERPSTNPKETKLDVPEIESLKQKVKDETKKLNEIDAQQKRVDDLETELERLQNRLPKEKNESVKNQISQKEQQIKDKIEEEKKAIRKENKENNSLRLNDAKDAVRQRIEKVKSEIAAKERELKEKNKPLNEDLELARLREIEKSITELRDKYLPEEKDPYEAEKQREKVKDKLVNDIIDLNEQINARKRTQKPDKADYSNDAEISKLSEIREAKKAILNEIDPLAVPKEKTTAERVATAEENLQTKIDGIREEIVNGERELKQTKSKLQSKKLDQLREQKKALESLRDKYLPKGKDPYVNEKAAKAVEDRLVKENIDLNRQIEKGEKDIKDDKKSIESENIDKLKAERDARKEILEAIDPSPKVYAENALIEQGFGKTIKVKTKNGVEERNVLDWKKLAGAEGSVSKISENVAKALEKSGFSEEQLSRMQDAFIDEYTNIRRDVIKKGLNVIAERNKTSVTPEQKSAAKKLAEMYNYGLFDKDLVGYETVLAKTIGVDKLNEANLKDAIVLGKSIADLFSSTFQGKRLTESQMRSAIQVIEDKMRFILHDEAQKHGSTALQLADLARTYMDLTQRMTLNSLKQAAENPLSGKMESLFSSIGYAGEIPKVLNAQTRKMARDIYKEMVLEKGVNYGDVSSTFVNKGNLEMQIDKMSDNKLLQGVMSTVIGRTTLDAVDSAYKAKITQQKFTYNLLKILQQDRMVNGKLEKGMSKEQARNYVAEKLTGQSFKEAQTTAKEIIDRINKGAKQKIFNDSPLFVDRLATDIVNAALVNGEKISTEQVTASYNAAYKAAGRGLGHVANNVISKQVASVSGRIESQINEALKQKEYRKAASLTVESIFFRNILNPFVGGGTNWVVLKAEKSGLGLLSGLGSMYRRGAKIDLMNEAGAKNLENSLYESLKIKDKFIRGAIGGATTVAAALIMNGITTSDEYRKWRLKNMWAAKYLDLVTPEIILATMAKQSGKTLQYLQTAFNKNDKFDKGTQTIKALVSYANDDGKASGKTGELVGSMFGAPTPWRLIRDGQQLWVGATGGEPYKIDNKPSETFLQGYFKGGMIDYAGLAPKPENNWFTPDELKSPEFKILEEKGISIPSEGTPKQHKIDVDEKHPNQAKEDEKPYGLMTDEEFKQFNDTKKKYLIKEINYILNKEYPKTEVKESGMDKRVGKVLGKDLPKLALKEKIEAATKDITKRIMEVMFPTPKDKIKTEYKSEEEREKEKIVLEEQLEKN